jgi:CRP-like cAMP-binding protein
VNADDVAAALSSSPIFAELDQAAVLEVARGATTRSFRKGELIFHEGDPGDSLYVLVEGAVKVFVTSALGGEMVLATLRPPDSLGEVALLDQGERSASAEALDEVTAIALARSTLLALIHQVPGIGDTVLRAAGSLLRRLTGQAADLVFLDLEGRVAKLLITLAHERGHERDGVIALDLGVTQTDLAHMVGGSRQSVNQILHSLAGRGFVNVLGREIEIVDLERLRRRSGIG